MRVEDTDVARSSKDMIQVILDGLTWLGLNWDEGPYLQSTRIDLYLKYAKKLLEQGLAYYCFCQPEELEKERKAAYKNKIDWQYDRRCLKLSKATREEKERLKVPGALRFLIPDHGIEYNDMIHGPIKREAKDIEDFVIMRPDGTPTYNFACVVDDYEMGISHVIRGVDHITNTPKQILLYQALGISKPEFAHLPLILGPDKKRLSKRHGAVSLMSYREQGFLPEAMVNFLSLLGWSTGTDKEIMKIEEIIQSFSLERINPANAVFDITKLEWMNGQYIYSLSDEKLLELLQPYIINLGLMKAEEFNLKKAWVLKICNLMKLRLKLLSDINKIGRFFFDDNFSYDEFALNKHLNKETLNVIKRYLPVMQNIDPYTALNLEQSLRTFATDNNLKPKILIHPLRVFITGMETGPGLFETMEVLGKEVCSRRIDKILNQYGKIDG